MIRTSLRPLLTAFTGLALLSGAALTTMEDAFAETVPRLADYIAAEAPRSFAEPSEAVEAFKATLAANDLAGLAGLLGLKPAPLQANADAVGAFAQIREGATRKIIVDDKGDSRIIRIGNILWPLPFPLVKNEDGRWAFDPQAGVEEIRARRIGENELETISTLNAYLDAQREYASEDRDGDGVLEFAQKLISSEGKTDGLYWPPDQSDSESPIGSMMVKTELDKAESGAGYFGYKFRILTKQGENIAGGPYDYVIGGNMIAGFGLIAYPVVYGETGIKTFVIGHQGIAYQTDLGPDTEALAANIDSFNPDDSWEVVSD
jgi:hypothetical protein